MHKQGDIMFKNIKQIIAGIITASLLIALPSISQEIGDSVIKQEVSENYNKQVECLAKNIYYEAGAESYEGKLAVAQVTMNRVKSGQFPTDICSVVYQKTVDQNLRTVCQFSWTCMAKELVSKNKYTWEESQMIAKRALTEPVLHDTIAQSNALYFHAAYIKPGWSKNRVIKQIGNHIFYSRI